MPEITFGEGATELIVEPFDMSVNEDGFLVDDLTGEMIEDPFGQKVNIENVGGVVHLESYDMTVDEDGRVLDAEGSPVSKNFEHESYNHTEALVHIRDETAILRDGFSNSADFVEAERTFEDTE